MQQAACKSLQHAASHSTRSAEQHGSSADRAAHNTRSAEHGMHAEPKAPCVLATDELGENKIHPQGFIKTQNPLCADLRTIMRLQYRQSMAGARVYTYS